MSRVAESDVARVIENLLDDLRSNREAGYKDVNGDHGAEANVTETVALTGARIELRMDDGQTFVVKIERVLR